MAKQGNASQHSERATRWFWNGHAAEPRINRGVVKRLNSGHQVAIGKMQVGKSAARWNRSAGKMNGLTVLRDFNLGKNVRGDRVTFDISEAGIDLWIEDDRAGVLRVRTGANDLQRKSGEDVGTVIPKVNVVENRVSRIARHVGEMIAWSPQRCVRKQAKIKVLGRPAALNAIEHGGDRQFSPSKTSAHDAQQSHKGRQPMERPLGVVGKGSCITLIVW